MQISPETIQLYGLIRAIFIILDIFLLAFFIFLIIKAWKFVPNFEKITETEKIYTLGNVILQERWESIIARSKINTQESIKHAILDADNMVDELLARMGLKGEHMADRLENLSSEDFGSLNRLWAAHRVKNNLIHEPGFVISQEDAQKTIADYGSFLKEIGVITK